MKLESAIALKAELKAAVFEQQAILVLSGVIGGAAGAMVGVAFGAAAARRYAAKPALGRIGIGISGTKNDYRIAVRIYQAAPGVEKAIELVRHRCKREIDERIVGPLFKQSPWYRNRNRPLRIGGSVGRTDEYAAGTLGCFVSSRTGSYNDFILSNNHVLAAENEGKSEDRIVQPGRLDKGKVRTDVVATLTRFKKLKKRNNLVDAAVAELRGNTEYYYDWIEGRGAIRGLRGTPLEIGDVVYKVGRTTGLTKGRVSAIEMDSVVVGDYNDGDLEFDEQIEIEPVGSKPFSRGGDSGSLIVDARRRVVGLLFAGNDVDATYANTIDNVLDALKIDLVY